MAEPREPGPPPPASARERLLAAAPAIALQGGLADLSLRELAAAIGTSHRMLLYHFGSREGLLAAVTLAVEEAERTALGLLLDLLATHDTEAVTEAFELF